jgi:RNA recognition motif-containing protein
MSSSQRSLLLTSQATSSSSASSSSRALSDRRLFVSNLAPQITEHDLLRLFKPYGTLRKLDFIFHRSGPQKGKPKGYAFVELVEKEGADKAKKALDGRSIKGREVHISYATVVSSSKGDVTASS